MGSISTAWGEQWSSYQCSRPFRLCQDRDLVRDLRLGGGDRCCRRASCQLATYERSKGMPPPDLIAATQQFVRRVMEVDTWDESCALLGLERVMARSSQEVELDAMAQFFDACYARSVTLGYVGYAGGNGKGGEAKEKWDSRRGGGGGGAVASGNGGGNGAVVRNDGKRGRSTSVNTSYHASVGGSVDARMPSCVRGGNGDVNTVGGTDGECQCESSSCRCSRSNRK